MTKWVVGEVIKINFWNKNLFSLNINASVNPFIAGQFTRLGLKINDELIQRAYSYVNAPNNKILEFYLSAIPHGKFTSKLYTLRSGDHLMVAKKASGFFILDEIPTCEILWMLATGTGLGPYLSILEYGVGIERFKHIVLVHAVRFLQDLSYLPRMLKLQKQYDKLRILTITSREKIKCDYSLIGRIPDLILNGSLEKKVKLQINSNNSHVMLCGNPQMVYDTQQLLKENRGMFRHFKHKPGHITSENYW